jgi:EAL domain-containing protein (putative c-di-GMP-specific phosphodiesterase class I)
MTIAGIDALRAGLAQGEIAVRYQPVVRVRDRRPMMVEALARWQPAGGDVSPDHFVALAERAGLVGELSAIVAASAIADLGPLWSRLRLGVTLNLPLALVLQPGLAASLDRAIGWSVLAPGRIAIELTETTPVRDLTRLQRALLRLRTAGYRVLLDDVMLQDGRDRLQALAFSGLKLDRSLVERLPGDGHARHGVRALVAAAEARGQTVIAEGVSRPAHWAALRGLGVHYAQGFAVGRPLPAEALPRWAADWRGGSSAAYA